VALSDRRENDSVGSLQLCVTGLLVALASTAIAGDQTALDTELARAVGWSNPGAVKEAIKKGGNPSAIIRTAPNNGPILHTAMGKAMADGKTEILQLLLDARADVNIRNELGLTVLHLGILFDHRELIALLLKHGAEVDFYCALGLGRAEAAAGFLQKDPALVNRRHCKTTPTPLGWAAISGDATTVKLLLDRGADANPEDKDSVSNGSMRSGARPIHTAAAGGHLEVVKLLVSAGADFNSRTAPGGCFIGGIDRYWNGSFTPLIVAASSGRAEVVGFLADKGDNLDAADDFGLTALHHAALLGDADIVKILLKHGADAQGKGVRRPSARGWEGFMPRTNPLSPLHLAVAEGHLGVAKALLEGRAQANAVDNQKRTPLHMAVGGWQYDYLIKGFDSDMRYGAEREPPKEKKGIRDVLKLLVSAGADVKVADAMGHTPLYYALLSLRDKDVIHLLEERGAKLEDSEREALAKHHFNDYDSSSLLHILAKSGQADLVAVLTGYGLDANARNKNDWTPLHVAAYEGTVEMAKTLIDNKADVNAREKSGQTALSLAAGRGSREMVTLFMDRGANPRLSDKFGWTPLHRAALAGHVDVARLLIERGVDVNITSGLPETGKNETPLAVAVRFHKEDVVKFLREHGAR